MFQKPEIKCRALPQEAVLVDGSIFKLSVIHVLGCSQNTKSYSSAQMGKLRHGWASPPQSLETELAMGPGSLQCGSLSTGLLGLSFCN